MDIEASLLQRYQDHTGGIEWNTVMEATSILIGECWIFR